VADADMPFAIPPVEDPDPDLQAILANGLAADGKPLTLFTTLAHQPRVLDRVIRLGAAFLYKSTLTARLRELVILRVAWRCGCDYEFGHHTLIGQSAGLTAAEVQLLCQPGIAFEVSEERLALATADALCARAPLPAAVASELRGTWSYAQLIELFTLIGFYQMLAGVITAGGISREPGVPDWPASAGGREGGG
jgi:4-carboxymuconolactone decarboxylase